MTRQVDMFLGSERLQMNESIQLTIDSLNVYGPRHDHWAIAWSGGKALGFAHAAAAHGDVTASFETVGGIDFDALACRDFEMLTGAPALCADVHQLEPADLIRFAGETAPDVVAMSPPCKGLSGLLSAKKAAEPKYQKMNTLMLRALLLVSATWATPPKLIFVENVPRMSSRGADVVRKSVAILEAHGYAVQIGTHDCGELGGLAQHRVRWFLLARHRGQVPNFVYQPPKRRVRACGEVLGPLPMPGDVDAAGPMHSVPNLSWRNWLRLAAIPAGGDWRDLPTVLDPGQQRREKFRRAPVTSFDAPADTVTGPGGSSSTNVADPRPTEWFPNVYRVGEWDKPSGTVTGSGKPSSGQFAVADPRIGLTCEPRAGAYGVLGFDAPSDAVTGAMGVDNGRAAIADPRIGISHRDGRHENKYAVTAWDHPAPVVIGAVQVGSGAPAVADPRVGQLAFSDNPERHRHKHHVLDWDDPAYTITSTQTVGGGAPSVADPRFGHVDRVTPWSEPVGTITRSPAPSSGAAAVADPRWGGGRFGVNDWAEPVGVVAGESLPNNGAFSVADPRFADGKKKNWQQVAGVTPWTEPAPTVTSGAKIHAGAFQVADPRTAPNPRYRIMTLADALELDLPLDKAPPFIPLIIADDGTWHRPLTTLELAVLQSLPPVIDGVPLVLAMRDGARSGHTRWREAIGNAVPPAAALEVGNQLIKALLLAALGVWSLDNNDIWVAPHQEALVA